jgi:hypothetical protein
MDLPEVLDDARLVHAGVLATSGPHVTPEAFAVESGRVWLVTGRATVKHTVLKRDHRLAGLAIKDRDAVMFTGTVKVVDPLTGRGVGSVADVIRVPLGALSYGSKNIRHVTGMAPDLKARMATLPATRVLLEVDVRRTAHLRDGSIVATSGSWPELDMLLVGEEDGERGRVPPYPGGEVAELADSFLSRSGPVSVGWRTGLGAVVLPGQWEPDARVIRLPASLLTLVGATSPAPACATFDAGRYRLSHKRGIMLRGMGSARRHGDDAVVRIDAERMTYWRGDESGTIVA